MRRTLDVRAQLQAIAAGKVKSAEPSDVLVKEAEVEKLQPDFRPWLEFADSCQTHRGERLTAPAEVLIPLP